MRHGHLHGHDVALASLSGSIGSNHLIAVGGLCLNLVGIGLLGTGSHSFEGFYNLTVANDVDGEVLSHFLAADCCLRCGE